MVYTISVDHFLFFHPKRKEKMTVENSEPPHEKEGPKIVISTSAAFDQAEKETETKEDEAVDEEKSKD